MSVTFTVKVHVLVKPALSVAVQVAVVTPRLNLVPEAGVQDDDLIPEPSVAVGLNAVVIQGLPKVGLTWMLVGHVMVGGVESVFETRN